MRKIIFIFFVYFSLFLLPKSEGSLELRKLDATTSYSGEMIGRITIPNTRINYSIVQHSDNDYYLNHNPYFEEDKMGSIFLDYRNHLNDRKLLIYGHNSCDGDALFKDLGRYLDYNFYEEHRDIWIEIMGEHFLYRVFSVVIAEDGDYRHTKVQFFTDEDYYRHLDYLEQESIYQGDSFYIEDMIMLQTCNCNPEGSFLLINARRIK